MFYYIIIRALRETAEFNDRKADIMRYINELHEGDRVSGIYLCKQKQSAVTKNGKPYDSIIIQDKNRHAGRQDLGIPNSLGIDEFDALDYIEIMGDVTSFAGGHAGKH